MLKIGDAAKFLGISKDTLRRWEKAGKITSQRTPSGYRAFDPKELERIKLPDTEQLTTEELLKNTHSAYQSHADSISSFPTSNITNLPISQAPQLYLTNLIQLSWLLSLLLNS